MKFGGQDPDRKKLIPLGRVWPPFWGPLGTSGAQGNPSGKRKTERTPETDTQSGKRQGNNRDRDMDRAEAGQDRTGKDWLGEAAQPTRWGGAVVLQVQSLKMQKRLLPIRKYYHFYSLIN